MNDPELDAMFGPTRVREPKPRARKKGAWKILKDGATSSDGVQANIASTARVVLGPPGKCNRDGVYWTGLEGGAPRSMAMNAILLARGVVPGFVEMAIIYQGRFYGAEVKRPESVGFVRRAAEKLLPSQEANHPEIRGAGAPVEVWRGPEDFMHSLRMWGIPHRRIFENVSRR